MQNRAILELSKENYKPSPSEKNLVHYKAEKIKFNPMTGERMSRPRIVKTGVKLFESVKRELEKEGYSIEILYHPGGAYNTPVNVPETGIGAAKAELEAKEKEIESLRAENHNLQAKLSDMSEKMNLILAKLESPKEDAPEDAPKKSNIEKAREAKAAKDAARKAE